MFYFILYFSVSFRFGQFRFDLFRFVSISFRFGEFRFDLFRFGSFRFVSFRIRFAFYRYPFDLGQPYSGLNGRCASTSGAKSTLMQPPAMFGCAIERVAAGDSDNLLASANR